MSTRSLHPLLQQFFDSLEKSDDEFLVSLSTLLRAAKQSSANNKETAPMLRQIDLTVTEERTPYDTQASRRDKSQRDKLDTARHTIGEALQQFLASNRMSPDDAARRLGITTEQVQQLADEMMPLTSDTVAGVARFFGLKFGLPELTLRHWLITGLRELEIKESEHRSKRMAARRKRS